MASDQVQTISVALQRMSSQVQNVTNVISRTPDNAELQETFDAALHSMNIFVTLLLDACNQRVPDIADLLVPAYAQDGPPIPTPMNGNGSGDEKKRKRKQQSQPLT